MEEIYLIRRIVVVIVIIFGLWGLTKFFFIFWLWYFYDRRIKNINGKLIDIPKEINEEFQGRGVTTAGIAPHIASRKRPLEAELEKLECNRRLFLDRIRLIFSIRRKL